MTYVFLQELETQTSHCKQLDGKKLEIPSPRESQLQLGWIRDEREGLSRYFAVPFSEFRIVFE